MAFRPRRTVHQTIADRMMTRPTTEPMEAPTMVPVEGWEPPSDSLAPVKIPVGLGLKEELGLDEVVLALASKDVDETVLRKVSMPVPDVDTDVITNTGGEDGELTVPLVDEGDTVRVDELLVLVLDEEEAVRVDELLEPDPIGMLSCDATLGMMFLAAATTREHSADPEYCAHDQPLEYDSYMTCSKSWSCPGAYTHIIVSNAKA